MRNDLDRRLAALETQLSPSSEQERIDRITKLFYARRLVNSGTEFIAAENEPASIHRIAELLNLARARQRMANHAI